MLSLIRKSSRTIILALFITTSLFFFFSTGALAATVTLAWDRPDGDVVAGYKIYYGLSGTIYKGSPRNTINSPARTQVDIANLEPGETYAFSVTSHDGKGYESDFSEGITYQVPLPRNTEHFTIAASTGNGGTIEQAGDTVVSYGGSVSYAILPDSGFEIADVTVNGSSVGPVGEYTFSNVSADNAIIASFKIIEEMDNKSEIPSDKPSSGSTVDSKRYTAEETVFLETDVYSHSIESAQVRYHWQIRHFGEKKPFYHVVSDVDLTDHEVQNELQSGLKYFWQVGVEDMDSELVSWSDERSFVVGESVLNHKILSVDPGTSIPDYKMVSFPHWVADSSSAKVFESMLESGDPRDYRILSYDPSIGRSGGYRQLGDFKVIPGKAYWVLARNGLVLAIEGVPVTTSSDILVPLDYSFSNSNGWSMVAVPNNASYRWGDVEVIVHDDDGEILYGPAPRRQLSSDNPYIDGRIWEWTPGIEGKYTAHDSNDFKLRPYGGYWVKVRAENVSLSFPYDMQLSEETLEKNESESLQRNSSQEKTGILQQETLDDDYNLYDNGDKPPMPLQGIDGNINEGDYQGEMKKDENNKDSNSSGCFIGSLSKSSK